MRYVVYLKDKHESFTTQWFSDTLIPAEPFVCFDLLRGRFTDDGINWHNIAEDHL